MAAAKEILSSGEEESRNLDEYLTIVKLRTRN